jgi:hypothetical protein
MAADKKYYRSPIHALSVVVGNPDPTKGDVAHPTVDFVPYWEERKGVEGKLKVGYLETDNGSAIKKLDGDHNVTEISKKEFEEATVESFDDNGNQVSGLRAPY